MSIPVRQVITTCKGCRYSSAQRKSWLTLVTWLNLLSEQHQGLLQVGMINKLITHKSCLLPNISQNIYIMLIGKNCITQLYYNYTQLLFRDLRSFEIWFEFELDYSDSIRKWRADSKFFNQLHLPSYHKPRSLFNKKLQPLRRCKFVTELYCMFM